MNKIHKGVFITPLEDGRVEVDADELLEAGLPPQQVEGGLAAAAWVVAAQYPEHRPYLLLDRVSASLADATAEFEQALALAREAMVAGGVG